MLYVRTLGEARIAGATVELTPVASKRFALVVLLAAERGRRIPRSMLLDFFFPDAQRAKAHHGLRELVYQVRKTGIDLDSSAYGVTLPETLVRCDWVEVLASADLDLATLRRLQGGFLPGYEPSFSPSFAQWLDSLRATQGLALVKLCIRSIENAKLTGNWGLGEQAARACLALDALNGHATMALAEMLALSGSAARAAHVLDSYATDLGSGAAKFAISPRTLRRRLEEESRVRYEPHGSLPFVGREREMAFLSRCLDESGHAGARGVLLCGEQGIGKSRLAREFAARIELEGCAVVHTRARPHDKQRPMGAIVDLLPSLLEQRGALGCSPDSLEWLNVVAGRSPVSHMQSRDMTHEETLASIARSFVDLLGAIVAEAPLLLIIDDAQWVDSTSFELLRNVVVADRPPALLLVLTAHNHPIIPSLSEWRESLTLYPVAPLQDGAIATIVNAELARLGEDDYSLSNWMVDISNGSPFYADCVIAHYRTTRERYAVPRELTAAVDLRIAALTPDARDVLEAIVALGKRATLSRIEAVLTLGGHALVRHLRELGVARLIVGDDPIEPSHRLIIEGVHRVAVGASQRALYRRIATVLESELRTDSDSNDLWECAEAWLAAGDSDRASTIFVTCADYALAIGRPQEASDLYYRAACMSAGSSSKRFAEAAIRCGSAAQDPLAIRRALAIIKRDGATIHDDIELAEAHARIVGDWAAEGIIPSLIDCLTDSSASSTHRLDAARCLMVLGDQGRLVRHVIANSGVIAELIRLDAVIDEDKNLPCAVVFAAICGDAASVASGAKRLVDLAARSPTYQSARLLRMAGTAFRRAGELERALHTWEHAYELASSEPLSHLANELRLHLIGANLDLGRPDRAKHLLSKTFKPTGSLEAPSSIFPYWIALSELALYNDDWLLLKEVGDEIRQLPHDELSLRIRRWRDAMFFLCRHLDGCVLAPQSLVNALTIEQVPQYESGDIGDLEMTILLTILRQQNRNDVARAAYARYLEKIRRPDVPLSAALRHASAGFTEIAADVPTAPRCGSSAPS